MSIVTPEMAGMPKRPEMPRLPLDYIMSNNIREYIKIDKEIDIVNAEINKKQSISKQNPLSLKEGIILKELQHKYINLCKESNSKREQIIEVLPYDAWVEVQCSGAKFKVKYLEDNFEYIQIN